MANTITRRAFSSGLATAGVLAASRTSAFGTFAANERVRLGIIGVGNRGDQLLDAFKPHQDAEFVAICDVYERYRDFAARKVGGQPFLTKDFRELLDRKDIDAVVIATPDHWHALQFVHACAAGKDVYVEKPLSLVVSEGRTMIDAARKHNRITQVGIHRRSVPICRQAAEYIQAGNLGKVTACRCFHIAHEGPMGIGNPPDSDPPAGLDWDTWLGPAPRVPYNQNRCFYKFRWFREYSGGQMTNFGTHWLDLIQWAIGQDAPRGVFAVGTHDAVKDNRNVPDTMEAVWDYPDGTLVSFSQYNANGAAGTPNGSYVEFRGTKGTLYLFGSKVEVTPEPIRLEPLPVLDPTNRKEASRQAGATTRPFESTVSFSGNTSETVSHARNFLDGLKSRKPCHCSVEVGHKSTVATLIANIACDRKRHLAWDADNERFTNDDVANRALAYAYRPPWKLEL